MTTMTQTAATAVVSLSRRKARAISVGGAVVATSSLYLAGRAAGVSFMLTDPGKTQHLQLVPYQIVMFTAFFALAGWGTLALLERFSRHAKAIWATLAAATLLLSFGPIAIEGASAATKTMLVTIHITVAVAAFTMLRRSPTAR
jgi:Family of unknown function (DUF6069)